jgi:DNA relaxase NicK
MICYDWLSFTAGDYKIPREKNFPERVLEMLGMAEKVDWDTIKGANGYKKRYYFSGVNVFFENPNYEDLVWTEMCGQGCRAFEEFSSVTWEQLFALVRERKDNVKRLDVAYDDFAGLLDLDTIVKEIEKGNWTGRFQNAKVIKSYSASSNGITVEIGSPSSDIMFTIYDKAAEQRSAKKKAKEELTDDDYKHWIRFEMQLRRERAMEFVERLQTQTVGELFSGILKNYLTFVTPSKTDTNKRRWKPRRWWTKFVGKAEAIKLTSPGKPNYNLEKCEGFVFKQCGNAIKTLIDIKGVDSFLEDLEAERSPFVNEKYVSLLSEYGKFEDKPAEDKQPKIIVQKERVHMFRCENCGKYKEDRDFVVSSIATGTGICRSCMSHDGEVLSSPRRSSARPSPSDCIKPDDLHLWRSKTPTTSADVKWEEYVQQKKENPLFNQWYEHEKKLRAKTDVHNP